MIVLQRHPGGLTEFMTFEPEYCVGNALTSWCADPTKAFGFARKIDAENFKKKYHNWFDHRTSIGEI